MSKLELVRPLTEGKLLLSILSTTVYFLYASQSLAFSFDEAGRFAKHTR